MKCETTDNTTCTCSMHVVCISRACSITLSKYLLRGGLVWNMYLTHDKNLIFETNNVVSNGNCRGNAITQICIYSTAWTQSVVL